MISNLEWVNDFAQDHLIKSSKMILFFRNGETAGEFTSKWDADILHSTAIIVFDTLHVCLIKLYWKEKEMHLCLLSLILYMAYKTNVYTIHFCECWLFWK